MAKVTFYKQDNRDNLIIFVHGFTGCVKTFKNKGGKFLHELLSKDISDNSDIAFFSYTTRWCDFIRARQLLNIIPGVGLDIKKSNPLDKYSQVLKTNCDLLLDKYKTVNFVCHSMGGVIVKKFIVNNFNNEHVFGGFYFTIGTPHKGTDLATLTKLFRNKQTEDLEPMSDFLIDLEHSWTQFNPKNVKYYCGLDDKIVSESSGCPLSGEENKIMVDGGHIEMPKPESSEDLIVQSLNSEIAKALNIGRGISPSVDDVLFLNYRISCEGYYQERGCDNVLERALQTKNIWNHGVSGTGKTATIQRYSILNDNMFCFVDLSPTPRDATVDDVIDDVYQSLFNYLSHQPYFDGDSFVETPNRVSSIIGLISCLKDIDIFYILLDELPANESFDMNQFVESVFTLTNVISNSVLTNVSLRLIVSTLFEPNTKISEAMLPKFNSLFYCNEIERWNSEDMAGLIEKIVRGLGMNFEREDIEAIIDSANGTPRFVKNVFQDYFINKDNKSLAQSVADIKSERVFS